MAPGSEPMPPSTAAVNALRPARKPMKKSITPQYSVTMTPATAARDAPMTNVRAMVLSTLTPTSAAMARSCSQARCARPSLVLPIRKENATMSTTVSTMIINCK